MKKLIALIMALAMCLALVACGGGNTSNPGNDASASNGGSSASSSGEAAGSGDSTPACDPLVIKFSSTFQQQETGGVIQQHFIDKLAELSGGAITVDISWGGTLFDSMGELDAVIDGVVDMVALGHMPHMDTLPYLSFPGFAPGGSQGAVDFFNGLIFDDPETSALIQGQAEDLGIKYLNVIAGGANAFCTKYEYTDLASMVAGSGSFGNFDAAIFEALGFQVTPVMPPETYDALNRGLIDSTQMGFAPMVAMAWYEPAHYWSLDGTYAAGNMFTVNLDWWNGLSAEQQAIIQEASDSAEAFSVTLCDEAIAGDIETVVAATGNEFIELSEDDLAAIWKATFEAKAADALRRAEAHNCVDEMVVILEKAAELTNYDWQH